MRKKITTILISLVFLIGLLVMLYPTISNWYNQRVNSYIVTDYVTELSNRTVEEYLEMFEVARAYNDTLTGTVSSFVSGEAEGEDYINALNVINGMMGYLVIDEIDVNLPIYHGTDAATLQTGVGHLEGTQLPTGDIGNNTVLTGHTGLPSADLLTGLTSMELGDLFQVYVLDKVYTYQVFAITVVEPTETDLLLPIEDKDVVTLVTCTPYGINSHRLLVQGEQIAVKDLSASTDTDTVVEVEEEKEISDYIPQIVIGILILLILISVIRSVRLRRQIKATRELDKKEEKEYTVRKLQKRFEKDEMKYRKKEEKRIHKLKRDEEKFAKKFEKQEQKVLAKIEKQDQKTLLNKEKQDQKTRNKDKKKDRKRVD